MLLFLVNAAFSSEELEDESGGEEGSGDDDDDGDGVLPPHLNPYLDQNPLGPDNFMQEFSKSVKALSKTTSADIENKVFYSFFLHFFSWRRGGGSSTHKK